MSDREMLTYERLEKEFAGFIRQAEKRDGAPLSERVLWCIGFVAAGFGSLIGVLLANETGLLVIRAGLVIEIGAFVAASALFIFRKRNAIRESHRTFAMECDDDYRDFRELVRWLGQFSEESREKRLRYLNFRRERMAHRMGLFTGGMEKLGVLPLIAVLYFQFKDWQFGDWQSLSQVNMLGGLLLWMLFLSYVAAWALVRLKSRLDSYATALEESLAGGQAP
jgi:hypothetical protein